MNNENNQLNFEKLNFFIEFFTLMGVIYAAFVSFFFPILGIILGIVFLSQKTTKIKKIGRIYLILGIIGIIIGMIFISIFLITGGLPFLKEFGY
ncbi:MAG: hypothetical protein N2323_03040 [candidate division WOR-3 bacterium]|nr:hypothetical protein [candidate division WOR-3 bacterium]MCX7836919.1 hypothetical protein [candidate division WOR-3 bacterium]MDW8114669.1 hypothetical protein [candidate division WOR-3 bacterium]